MRLNKNQMVKFLMQTYKLLKGTEYSKLLEGYNPRNKDEEYLLKSCMHYQKVLMQAALANPHLRGEATCLIKSLSKGSVKSIP
jgi:hypothetical protein